MMPLSRLISLLGRWVPLTAFLTYGVASAHPHVWIKYAVRVDMRGTLILSIGETWRFSEGFPFQLVGVASLPKNGPLNARETALFRDQAFSHLADVQYFNHLVVDGEPQPFRDPADFRVSVEHGEIVYTFTLKLAKPVQVMRHHVTLGIWDDTFFVDYEPEATKTAISISGHSAITCTMKSFADRAHPIFGGIVIPQATTISC
ncbi:DUF1007 family protein [Burkholderia sp. JSH-S8]|nr:DUF1007 family protein [Burkholderia sp. JSH-S8]